jgi:REP element-mobilizing transposase RayT
MVNHVHVLIYPEARLSRITKAIKNYSARQANAMFAHHWAQRACRLGKTNRTIIGAAAAGVGRYRSLY